MFQAYFDESGIQDGASVCLVGGYFGGPGQWRKFGQEWQAILDEYEVPEFHAKQFWAFNDYGQRVGPYKGWSATKAETFLGKLVGVIDSHKKKIHPIGAVLVVEAFNRLTYNQRRFLTGGALRDGRFVTSGAPSKPYFLAFQSACLGVAHHAPVGGKAHFAFDLNKNFKGYALDLYSLLKETDLKVKGRLGEIAFPTGQEVVQLQAADLFCYLDYQFCKRKVQNKNEQPDPLLRSVLQGMLSEHDFPFLNDEGLAVVLEGVKLPPG